MEPAWISHRGYKKNAGENTLQAFEAARRFGLQVLETDLRVTRDDQLILFHDPTLLRYCGNRTPITDMTLSELETLGLEAPHPIARFEDFAAQFADCQWVLDVKPEEAPRTISALLSWAKRTRMHDFLRERCRFLMWSARDEVLISQGVEGAHFYARKSQCWISGLAAIISRGMWASVDPTRIYSLPPHLGTLDLFQAKYVEAFHRRGAKVLAFLPKTAGECRQAVKAGFDQLLIDNAEWRGQT